MKIVKILIWISFLFSWIYQTFAVTHESCNSGIYSSYYDNTCTICWYHDFRFYRWTNYWLWDFFLNNQNKEYLVSTNTNYSYAKINNIWANVSYTLWNYVWTNTWWLTANWLPQGKWINWNKDAVIFVINNVSWNQNITDRNIPIWMVEYNLRNYEVTDLWNSSINTTYSYLSWSEVLSSNWLLDLNTSWVNSTWFKKYNSIPEDHKECYVMLPAWCWDWVKDSNETCDPNDATKTWWWAGTCNASCQVVAWTCTAWTVTWSQSSAITSSTSWLCQTWAVVWNFTSIVSWNTTNYTWTCDGNTWWNCSASYTTSWWGGWTPDCVSGWVTWAQSAPITASTPWLCQTWAVVWGFTSWWNWNTTNYIWTCNWNTWWNCLASYTTSWWWGWGGWWWGWWGGWWSSTYCWDWILQRPNSVWTNEECDFWSWTWPNWCNRTDCQIIESTTPGWFTDSWESSIPGWWTISLYPKWDLLIWHWMSVFGNLLENSYIQNTSNSDIYLDTPICVYKENVSYAIISWATSVCTSWEVWLLRKNWWTKSINVSDSTFVWTVSFMPSNLDYADAKLITTLAWFKDADTFLKSTLNVRVSRPTVVTVWGWASLLNWTIYADLNNLSSWWFLLLKPEINKNLILTSLWVNPLSSYVKSISDVNILESSVNEWNKDLENISNFSVNSNNATSVFNLPTENYNWLENVYIHKWNVSLVSQTISGGNKTYIIEDWDLTINWNINSSWSVLFVVKNWNIYIKNEVTNIDWIIINIWWKVKWDSNYTLNRLVINWAIYWQLDDLLTKRTYIKDRWEYVDVWTVVNFTSKIFTSPPPLLSKFLWEYTNLQKTPK